MDRRILVVDDSELVCQQLSQLLASPDRQIKVAPDGTTALEWLVENRCSLVLTDLRLPGDQRPGPDPRDPANARLPVTVIVMTGYATVESAVEAMKLGAYDLILKPIDTIRLEVLVEPGAGGPPADRRGGRPAGPAPEEVRLSQPAGAKPADDGGLRPGGAGGVVAVQRAGHRRDGHRQGAGRPGDPLQRRDPARAPGRRQLRGLARAPAGERALRPRARRLHRGRPPEEGAVRAGRRGHALPRRDRRDAAGHAGQALARAPGRAVRAGRRDRADRDRLPRHRRHEPQPRRGRRRRPVPRGPVLPAQRRLDRAAPAARAARGHPAPGQPLPREADRARTAVPDGLAPGPVAAALATTGRATCASSSTSSSRRWSRPPAR